MSTWVPPHGATELEPGWWQARNGSLYSDPTPRMRTDEDRAALRDRAMQRTRHEAALVPGLIDRLQGLEFQACLAEQFLEATLMLWQEERERVAFLEGVLAGVLEEGRLSGVREAGR